LLVGISEADIHGQLGKDFPVILSIDGIAPLPLAEWTMNAGDLRFGGSVE